MHFTIPMISTKLSDQRVTSSVILKNVHHAFIYDEFKNNKNATKTAKKL